MQTDTLDRPAPLAPAPDCPHCPRLVAERHGPPVVSRGPLAARLLIVDTAPQAGGHEDAALLRDALSRCGRAAPARENGAAELLDTRITHALRCAAPEGLPEPAEINACNDFLAGELAALTELRGVFALGAVAHAAVLQACGVPATRFRYHNGAIHRLPDGLILADGHALARYRGAAPEPSETLAATLLALLARLDAVE